MNGVKLNELRFNNMMKKKIFKERKKELEEIFYKINDEERETKITIILCNHSRNSKKMLIEFKKIKKGMQ
jgi:hypothetical protein